MQQDAGMVGVEITYYDDAPVILDCESEAEAQDIVQRIESAVSSGRQEIELDNLVKVSLANVRSIGLAAR